jgi:hypothetical protein
LIITTIFYIFLLYLDALLADETWLKVNILYYYPAYSSVKIRKAKSITDLPDYQYNNSLTYQIINTITVTVRIPAIVLAIYSPSRISVKHGMDDIHCYRDKGTSIKLLGGRSMFFFWKNDMKYTHTKF